MAPKAMETRNGALDKRLKAMLKNAQKMKALELGLQEAGDLKAVAEAKAAWKAELAELKKVNGGFL